MAPISYSAKAPGTLMLLGEHAVLHDKTAIVMAVDQWMSVSLNTRIDRKIRIFSDLGKLELEISDLKETKIQKPFQFVLAALQYFEKELKAKKSGFDLNIQSEFKHNVGLGSSAAVTVATVAVLFKFLEEFVSFSLEKVRETAMTIVRKVQGMGSGADVAASVYGGILAYQQTAPYVLKQLSTDLPLTVVYSGSKTPTPEVVRQVEELENKDPQRINALYKTMDEAAKKAIGLIEQEDWPKLGEIFNSQQDIMNALGVATPLLNQLCERLNAEPGIYGAKISGAGLGDCVMGVGAQRMVSNQTVPVAVSQQGLHYE